MIRLDFPERVLLKGSIVHKGSIIGFLETERT